MKTPSENPFTVARWTRSTFLGWLAGVALIIALSSLLDSMGIEHMQFYLGLGMGLGVDLLQFLMLKSHSPKAGLWIVSCPIGWALAVMTVFTIDYTKHLTSFISSNLLLAFINLLLILAGGIVLGIITGLSLKKILENIPAWTTKLPGS